MTDFRISAEQNSFVVEIYETIKYYTRGAKK